MRFRLRELSRELGELDWIIDKFEQITATELGSSRIRTISSSDYSVLVEVALPVAACLMLTIERFAALYRQTLEIRLLRLQLEEKKFAKSTLDDADDRAQQLRTQAMEEIKTQIKERFWKVDDPSRANELDGILDEVLARISSRVERGFTMEVRFELPAGEAATERTADERQQAFETLLAIEQKTGRLIVSRPARHQLKGPSASLGNEHDGERHDKPENTDGD